MRSKNSKAHTAAESAHLAAVKALPCSLCDANPPSAAHHVNQGQHFTAIALCYECHQGRDGWHGTKVLWRIRKWDEWDALNVTIERLGLS